MDLYALIGNLQTLGFFDVVLPFTLFFAVIYAVIMQFGIFTKEKTGSNTIPAIISICMAFFATAYTPYGMTFGPYLVELFGKAGTVMASMLVFIVLLGMTGIQFKDGGLGDLIKSKYIVGAILLISIIIYVTTGATGSGVNFSNIFSGTNSETVGTITLLALIGAVIWFVVKGDTPPKTGGSGSTTGDAAKGKDGS
ncbi:MAG: hypothetical protein KAJ47_03290 [Candidatus Aenigmarchaeota archaeon]|nr:hypothetical protein [Candidatus Aenigmarchaeota archaeon]